MNRNHFIRLARASICGAALMLFGAACNAVQPAPTGTPLQSPLPLPTALPLVTDNANPTPVIGTTEFATGTGKLIFAYDLSGLFQIGMLDMQTGELKQLTSSPDPGDAEPAWSADGKFIIFNSGRRNSTNFEIYRMNADGSDPQPIISGERGNYSPAYSFDGSKLVFHTNRDGNMEVYAANADGSNPVNLTNHPSNDGAASWSPDGSKIVFSSDRSGEMQMYVMNADGSDARLLLDHPEWSDFRPRYSPDGTRIVFGTQKRYTDDYFIAMIDADGSNFRFITSGVGESAQASWMGNDKLVFSRRLPDIEKWQLYVLEMKTEGGMLIYPISLPSANYRNPSWTP